MDKIKLLKAMGIGRFQVMALLQAARHYIIHKDLKKAKSFGLNRAIFYAWAKHYGPRSRPWISLKIEEILNKPSSVEKKKTRCPEGYVEVLGECVQVDSLGYYVIGEKSQTPQDFDYQVLKRIGKVTNPNKVWEIAVEYVSMFPKWVLEDPQKFYKLVYEPVRDYFIMEIVRGEKPKPPQNLLGKLRSLEEMYRKIKSKQKTLFDFS